MQRRALLTTASALLVAGCSTETTEQSSPSDSPAASSSVHSSSPTPTPSETHSDTVPECSPTPDLSISNYTSRRLTVSVTVTTAGGRHRGGTSPTPTRGSTPQTETPVQTYQETLELDPYPDSDHTKNYERVPRKTGQHRLVIDIEDGPEQTFGFRPPYGDRRGFKVSIDEGDGITGGVSGSIC